MKRLQLHQLSQFSLQTQVWTRLQLVLVPQSVPHFQPAHRSQSHYLYQALRHSVLVYLNQSQNRQVPLSLFQCLQVYLSLYLSL